MCRRIRRNKTPQSTDFAEFFRAEIFVAGLFGNEVALSRRRRSRDIPHPAALR